MDVDYPIVALRVDPTQVDLRLLSHSERLDDAPRNAAEWVEDFDLLAAINAGMYMEDYRTNTGLMKNFDHVNNPRMNPKYNVVFAFNPNRGGIPRARLVDLDCHDFEAIRQPLQLGGDTRIQLVRQDLLQRPLSLLDRVVAGEQRGKREHQ